MEQSFKKDLISFLTKNAILLWYDNVRKHLYNS